MDFGPLIVFYHLLTTFHIFRVSFVDEMVVRVILDTKGGSCSQAFLAETEETGNKSRRVTEATHARMFYVSLVWSTGRFMAVLWVIMLTVFSLRKGFFFIEILSCS